MRISCFPANDKKTFGFVPSGSYVRVYHPRRDNFNILMAMETSGSGTILCK